MEQVRRLARTMIVARDRGGQGNGRLLITKIRSTGACSSDCQSIDSWRATLLYGPPTGSCYALVLSVRPSRSGP